MTPSSHRISLAREPSAKKAAIASRSFTFQACSNSLSEPDSGRGRYPSSTNSVPTRLPTTTAPPAIAETCQARRKARFIARRRRRWRSSGVRPSSDRRVERLAWCVTYRSVCRAISCWKRCAGRTAIQNRTLQARLQRKARPRGLGPTRCTTPTTLARVAIRTVHTYGLNRIWIAPISIATVRTVDSATTTMPPRRGTSSEPRATTAASVMPA